MIKNFMAPCGRVLTYLSLALGLSTLGAATDASQSQAGEQEKIKLDVPYEPSSEDVVEVMLQLARVNKDDFVYDLGCGDGRIVIEAARRVGARGIGVDLDPERIRESVENARKGGVTDRIQFFQEDLFQTEISRATVVMLYLWPEVNLKLRPRLFRELKPGTRVVSHSHDMGPWEPDQTVVASNGHRVHLWIVPANVTGVWEWQMPKEKKRYALKLSQKFQKVSGTLQIGSEQVSVNDFILSGEHLEFTVERSFSGQTERMHFRGRVQGHLLEGEFEKTAAGSQGQMKWKATRDPSSSSPLDS
jgi:SAM-dependent methyltransferase